MGRCRGEHQDAPELGADIDGPFGFVAWGDVDTAALHVPPSRLAPNLPGYPEWVHEPPPTEDEIARAWKTHAGARTRAHDGPRFGRKASEDAEALEHRRDDESADDFYKRVASFYVREMRTSGKPTRDIETAAGVRRPTAARWVREARARGFLRPTTKGRTRS